MQASPLKTPHRAGSAERERHRASYRRAGALSVEQSTDTKWYRIRPNAGEGLGSRKKPFKPAGLTWLTRLWPEMQPSVKYLRTRKAEMMLKHVQARVRPCAIPLRGIWCAPTAHSRMWRSRLTLAEPATSAAGTLAAIDRFSHTSTQTPTCTSSKLHFSVSENYRSRHQDAME